MAFERRKSKNSQPSSCSSFNTAWKAAISGISEALLFVSSYARIMYQRHVCSYNPVCELYAEMRSCLSRNSKHPARRNVITQREKHLAALREKLIAPYIAENPRRLTPGKALGAIE